MQPSTIENRRIEVLDHLCDFVEDIVNTKMLIPETSWQPSDFLPDFRSESFGEDVTALQERAKNIPNTLIISLVGNMITEEGLPNYQSWFNLLEGINRERNVASDYAWVKWGRAWASEENRHGDLLNKYLYMSGRIDMNAVEKTIQRMLYNGFDNLTDGDPYKGIIYTAFQERATKITHVNTSRLASQAGDDHLSRICKVIAGDEARHENAYKAMMKRIFELDPNEAILAFGHMMWKHIVMPARMMDVKDNKLSLFDTYAAITQEIGIYTSLDYANIVEHLVDFWGVEYLKDLTSEGNKMQDYLCKIPERYKKLAERVQFSPEPAMIWM